jgi:GTP-binding protein Era
MPEFVSGFVSIIGRPNVGKSTLLNALVGTKLAAVGSKPQTTRTLVQGVVTLEHAQIVLLDTPGIHGADSQLNRRMMESLREALDARDLLLYVVDAAAPFGPADQDALELIGKPDTPTFLVLNKIDRLADKGRMLPLIEEYRSLGEFAEYIPISARRGEGVEELKSLIVARLPEGPAYFPPDYLTDQPERFLAAELIREKILAETREEVPHAVAVTVDNWEETEKLTRIAATIYVEREGQKGILIGAKGATLKRVGTLARQEMETLFGRKIFLELYVRVQPRWRERGAFLDQLDWRRMLEG